MPIQVVILAAGLGKRMQSQHPKVLQCIGGKPLLSHVVQTALAIAPQSSPIVVIGHQGARVKAEFSAQPLRWVEQKEQLGTGHALLQALPLIEDKDQVLVLSGDVPLLSPPTIQRLLAATPASAIGLLTATLSDAKGYGRIVRAKDGHITRIVEEKDANADERSIQEINAGVYVFPGSLLKQYLPKITNQNAQGEYYLPDVITKAVQQHVAVNDAQADSLDEILGVNDRVQLAQLERCYQRRQAEALMRQGVTLLDPARVDIRGDVQVGADTIIDINVILEGRVEIGRGCVIGANTCIRNAQLGDQVEVKANSVIDGAEIEDGCVIGPFARIRPGTVLAAEVHIGNFVEIKNSIVREGSKINHLSYIGDSDVGQHVNIGAGTITCNYDGTNKHKTTIGDHVHIGSGTQLVAPVMIGEGATLGAGSTLTQNAPPHQLTLTHRLEQRTVPAWSRPVKTEKIEN